MCCPKHVEQLRNIGVINSNTRSHLVGSLYEISITMHGSMYIKFVLSSADHVTLRTNSMRLALLTVHVSSLVLFFHYSAAFTTGCTLQEPTLPFTNFEELLRDGSYRLGMIRASAQMEYFKVSRSNILIYLILDRPRSLQSTTVETYVRYILPTYITHVKIYFSEEDLHEIRVNNILETGFPQHQRLTL